MKTAFITGAAGFIGSVCAKTLAKEGVVVGYPDGNFKADSLVDRAEFSTMVIKALAQEHSPIKAEIHFTDVPYYHWAYDMIQRAVYFELIDGNLI